MKLNVDGSMCESLLGGSGCIRDEHGNWILGFAKFIGIGSTLQEELWTMYLGLKLASSMNIVKLEVETYSNLVIDLIKNHENTYHPLHSLILN